MRTPTSPCGGWVRRRRRSCHFRVEGRRESRSDDPMIADRRLWRADQRHHAVREWHRQQRTVSRDQVSRSWPRADDRKAVRRSEDGASGRSSICVPGVVARDGDGLVRGCERTLPTRAGLYMRRKGDLAAGKAARGTAQGRAARSVCSRPARRRDGACPLALPVGADDCDGSGAKEFGFIDRLAFGHASESYPIAEVIAKTTGRKSGAGDRACVHRQVLR